jgi:hypothetical protein
MMVAPPVYRRYTHPMRQILWKCDRRACGTTATTSFSDDPPLPAGWARVNYSEPSRGHVDAVRQVLTHLCPGCVSRALDKRETKDDDAEPVPRGRLS